MSYGEFVKDLPLTLRRHIIAYDNLPHHQGCILYFRGGPRRVELDARVFDCDHSTVADALHEVLERPPNEKLWVTLEAGSVVIKPAEAQGRASNLHEDALPA